MKSAWDTKILEKMEPGCVTFKWDDGEIRTIPAPQGALDEMKSAWTWIDETLRKLTEERGRPRSVCFRLSDGQFRGLNFPDWQPGVMD